MIQILAVKELSDRQKICDKAGIPYDETLHIIASFSESGQVEQAAIFQYEGTNGELLWIDSSEDIDVTDGIAKAILSIMELHNVKRVSMPLKFSDLAKRLKFAKSEKCYTLNLEGYFCCNCQHNQ